MDYPTEYVGAVRYGRAPREDMVSMVKAAHYDPNSAFDPHNTPDAVLADYLGDHDDPREEIVRQDLAIRNRNGRDWGTRLTRHGTEKFGPHYENLRHPPITLIDGSEMLVDDLNSRDTDSLVGHRVYWTPIPYLPHSYVAHFTPDEYQQLLTKLKQ